MNKLNIAMASAIALMSPAADAATNVTAQAEVRFPSRAQAAFDGRTKFLAEPDFSPLQRASVAAIGASAWGTADLRTGTFKGFASSVGTPNMASFNLGFEDDLYFNVAGASADTRTLAYLQIDFDALHQRSGQTTMQTYIGDFGASSTATIFFAPFHTTNGLTLSSSNPIESFNDRSIAFTRPTPGTASGTTSYQLPFEIVGSNRALYLRSSVLGLGDGDASINFANSGHLRLVLPSNVTFTSASGTALSGAVPEPTTWALLIAGFGLTGIVARRRRQLTMVFG